MLGYSWHVWAALETITTYRCRIDLISLQGLNSKLILYALNLRSRKDRNTKTQHFHIHSLEVSKNALKNEFTDYKSRIFPANILSTNQQLENLYGQGFTSAVIIGNQVTLFYF